MILVMKQILSELTLYIKANFNEMFKNILLHYSFRDRLQVIEIQ